MPWVIYPIRPKAISGRFLFSVFRCLRSNNLLYLNAAMDPIDLIREGKVKRYFRATKKLSAPGIISHITQRAAGKEPLFLEESDYLFMLGRLKEISMNYSLEIYAFCLMPNMFICSSVLGKIIFPMQCGICFQDML